jgi:hypothetical protein
MPSIFLYVSIPITASDIEEKFGTSDGSAAFPNFCNAVIVAAGPLVSSLPSLTERPGSDGGKDGEWLITDDEAIARSPFTSVGWNVFQFTAYGLGAKGRNVAISQLVRKLQGAVRAIVDRHETRQVPAQYTAFTNLQLGLETPMLTSAKSRVSTDIEKIRASILRESPSDVRVMIAHASTLAALVNAHASLRLAYFSDSVGVSWEEKWKLEQRISPFAASIPLTGREDELQRLTAFLRADNIRVVALTGPSGMGKTRLALEATRGSAIQTVVIERADRFDEAVIPSLATSNRETILLVEDPSREQAERIAKQAVAVDRLKVVLTIPTKREAPELHLLGHPAIETLPLRGLTRDGAEELLDVAKADFDTRARDWILLQSGKIPAILLAASEASADLREKSGELREQLGRRFSQKVEKALGLSGVEALQVLSPLQWVDVNHGSSQLRLLLQSQQSNLSEGDVLRLLPSLDEMGYVRTRGKFASVVPPLFAASLARSLFTLMPRIGRDLFGGLDSTGRERLLERIITLELDDAHPLWDYFFGAEGPFAPIKTVENLSLLNFLARAAPRQTARFLRLHFDTIVAGLAADESRHELGELRAVLGELLEEPETSADALELVKTLAVKEIKRGEAGRATIEYAECFVHWFPFPLPYAARSDIARALVVSTDASERELGVRVVIIATNPPHSMSGRSGNARRLGPPPARQLMEDVWQFLSGMIELRFALCESVDARIAEIAKKDFLLSFERLDHDLPVMQLLPLLERIIDVHFEGKIGSNDSDARSILHSLRLRWTGSRDKDPQKRYTKEWSEAIARLDRLIARFDEAPFERRLKIAVGRAVAFDYEDIEGERLYSYQKRLRILAEEAIANPTLMTEDAWAALFVPEAHNATEFASALGQLDEAHVFASAFERRAVDWGTSGPLAFYLQAQTKKHAVWVESRLDELLGDREFARVAVLQAVKIIGPTAKNVRHVLRMITTKEVTPMEIAQTFSTGKWLDDLTVQQVAVIFDYMATDDETEPWLLSDLNLYLHYKKPLPRELFDVARRLLTSSRNHLHSHSHYLDNIGLGLAKTDLRAGIQLFEEQIQKLARRRHFAKWDPLEAFSQRNFWKHLRDESPEAAYRSLGQFQSVARRITDYRSQRDHPILDLVNHSDILLVIAQSDRTAAVVFIQMLSVKQPGVFDFAYSLLQLYPDDQEIRIRLGAAIIGSDFDQGDLAWKKVNEQLALRELPPYAAIWLRGLRDSIDERRRQYSRYFGTDEFLGWD